MITIENGGEVGAFERRHRRDERNAEKPTDLMQFTLGMLN